jgi:hypothetical protein
MFKKAYYGAVQLTSLFNVLIEHTPITKHTIHKSQLSSVHIPACAGMHMPNFDSHTQNTNTVTFFIELFGSWAHVVP